MPTLDHPLDVIVWTPIGVPRRIRAADPDHAARLIKDNPKPLRVRLHDFTLTDGRRVELDMDVQECRLPDLKAAGYEVTRLPDRPDSAAKPAIPVKDCRVVRYPYLPHPSETAVYIGRARADRVASPLANPYRLADRGDLAARQTAINRYDAWLTACLTDPASPQREELDRLAGLLAAGHRLRLECFCAPLPCHGDMLTRLLLRKSF